jgi:DNA-binding NarL/FixJ family response regulator
MSLPPAGIKSAGPDADLEPSVPTTVLVADDHPLVLAGLRRALRSQPDSVLVGEARTAAELLELTRRRRPHVVVMDLSMPGMAGIEAIDRIRRERPQTHVVVLSASDE